MSVSGLPIDLYPFLQFIFTAFLIAIGILHLVKSTASKYFVVDDTNFEEGERERERRRERERGEVAFQNNCQKNRNQMVAVANTGDGSCAFCGKLGIKQCSSCKAVKYCSGGCQSEHWKAGHKKKCRELKLFRAIDATPSVTSCGAKDSVCDINSSKGLPRLKTVLFPYEDFVKLFNWEKMVFFPCGLLNCGNSCYANVVLQCLSCTRPLIAYLMEVGHKKKCRRNDWCFLCELEVHVVRARFSRQPFSPMNILSRLPNIGANLGYGKQEDAHEFMRFAIDTMQSVCLDEFGGEKSLHPSSQETTLIQYIFGGHLQSQVKCSECNKISYRHENMMDLTVEIQGDAESLEECLDQFTAEELLDGENMYKCEGCNDYVKASKRLAIHHAPNILTIALKRFQSGRFGKLNKRVAFPETLDLGPYMTEPRHGTDLYRLYAVVVHVDMLNASYFGHYICYTKDSHGNWHRLDDCRVTTVDLEEVLAQGAYMLLYSRTCVRPSFVKPLESFKEEKQEEALAEEDQPCSQESVDSEGSIESFSTVASLSADVRSHEEEEMEAQPCFQFPVEGSLKTMPSDVRSSTPEPSSEKNDLVCMNLDEPVEVNSRFGRAIMTDIPIDDVKSNSLDMEVDSDSASCVCMQLDDSDNKQSNSTGIGSSLEDISGGLLTSAPLTEAIQPSETHDLNFEVSGTTSNKQIFEAGYKVCNEELISSKGSVDNSLPSQSDIRELAETTCSLPSSGLNSVSSNLQEGSSSSFCSTQKVKLKQDTPLESFSGSPAAQITKGHNSRLVGYKSCSNRKQRPVFYPGFLDKRLRKSEQCLNGAEQFSPGFLDKQSRGKFHNRNDAPEGLGEVGSSCKVNNCNGSTNPDSLLQNGSEANNYDRNLGCTNVLKSAKVIENNAKKIFMEKDERIGRALGEGGDSCNNIDENKTCNLNQTQGTYLGNGKDLFSPGFLNRPSRKNSLKKNCENTSMDEDERIDNILREACDPPQSHCNGNDNGFCFDENRICDKNQRREMCCGNDNDIGSPGIRRKNNSLINDEEGTSLSEAVSSNHDRSKFPRVG